MTRRTIDLTGSGWRLGQAPATAVPERATWQEMQEVDEWIPATVPGNVRADLMQAGTLPDLYFGLNSHEAKWVDDHCWWLVRDFDVQTTDLPRAHLVLEGIDYLSDLFLNGQHLGRHEGMFSPQVHDVTDLVRRENRLAVRIVGSRWLPEDRSSAWEKCLNVLEVRLGKLAASYPHRRDTMKCQMGFGWDFAPALRTMGIWNDVILILGDHVFVRRISVSQQTSVERSTLAIRADVDARGQHHVRFRCTLAGETFEAEPLVFQERAELRPGSSSHTIEVAVPRPRLWWPWDLGQPDLYRLTVEVMEGEDILDAVTETVGLRHIEFEDWRLRVNGTPLYARGANWVPADILSGRVGKAGYQALLAKAREANMNMLRVWGGGLSEKRAFYDLCDRLGILVWQEFPFACAFLTRFPRSQEYGSLIDTEARAIVRSLRNHPSLAIWCGGNEFSPERNGPLVDTLRRVVAQEDPSRPFLPASPALGDSHYWRVWHHFHPASAYREDEARFASEFGLQAPPNTETLRRFIPASDLWPPGPAWAHHGADFQKLRRYADAFLADQEPSLDAFVQASQRAQAYALQIAIEHYRRSKVRGCSGVLLWQLNEPWPAISWALLDYYRQPKPAYSIVKRLYAPLLVSLEYPLKRYLPGEPFCARVWIINDRDETLSGCQLVAHLWDRTGNQIGEFACGLEVAAFSASCAGELHGTLPAGGGWRLTGQLIHNDQTRASNEYDLAVHDGIMPKPQQRLWNWLTGLVTPS